MGRNLRLSIFRYRPNRSEIEPRMQEYTIEEEPHMTVYIVLTKLRENQDPSLLFDFSCRAGICGSCAMLINGRPKLGCKTLTETLPEEIVLKPLPTFKLIGDLSVDSGAWFREVNIRLESWVHQREPFDPSSEEERMSNKTALEIFESDRCIECGCCIAACVPANMREDFIGAAGIYHVGRFMIDPRDQRDEAEYFKVVGMEAGIVTCTGLMECDNYCPQEIPLQEQIAYVRRRMLRSLFGWRRKSARA